MDIEEVTADRKAVYGDYKAGVKLRVDIMTLIKNRYYEEHNKPMEALHEVYFEDVVNKLHRLAVSPDHIDSWVDIQGYAKRIEEALTSEILND